MFNKGLQFFRLTDLTMRNSLLLAAAVLISSVYAVAVANPVQQLLPGLCLLSPPSNVQRSLESKYKGQILALRHPLKGADQQYDVSGNVLSSDSEGPWTVFGRVKIEEIRVESRRLRIKAARIQYQFDQEVKDLVPVPTKDHVTLDIALAKRLSSEADSVLSSVFALTDQDVLNTAPQFWRDYLRKHLGSVSATAQEQQGSSAEQTNAIPQDENKVHRVGENAVTAPRTLFTPEPEFTDAARKTRYQGVLVVSVVVGSDGLVKKLSIVRPLGMGLDENAVARISTWRFRPGTKNGEPVAVAMNVEVSFNLYHRK